MKAQEPFTSLDSYFSYCFKNLLKSQLVIKRESTLSSPVLSSPEIS